MISHWYIEGKMDKASRLDYNLVNFVTEAGEYSRRFFQFSFASGGFYGRGQSWKPRTSRWGKRQPHPVLIDSGKLKESIKGENIFNNKGDVKHAADDKFKSNYRPTDISFYHKPAYQTQTRAKTIHWYLGETE